MNRRRIVARVPLLLLVACTAAVGPTVPSGTAGGLYRDPAGWSIQVEPGWRVVAFTGSDRGARAFGAQISNVDLPRPVVRLSYPLQANGLVLPQNGLALVIGADNDPKFPRQGPLATPPLSWPDGWTEGSCLSGNPCLDTIWFHAGPGGEVFIATLKIGADAWHDRSDLAAVKRMIRSLRF